MKKPSCVVCLGKLGDIILMLPAFKKMAERDGVNPIVMVSTEYASVLDGVSYVSPWAVPMHWAHDVQKAREAAELHFEQAIVPAWWNDESMLESEAKKLFHGANPPFAFINVNGKNLALEADKEPNYMASMWLRCGTPEVSALPIVFDKRRPIEENNLCAQWFHIRKPTVLYNFTGTSSPFAFPSELFTVMREFRDLIHFVDLGEIKAGKIYDLLGLYDNAIGLITIDTATLHLAAASKVPYIGITKEGWSGSVCKGNCALTFKYGETPAKKDAVRKVLTTWLRQFSPKHKFDRNDPPSVLTQTQWKCSIIDTPRESGDFFNAGLVTVKNQDYLLARRCWTPVGSKFSKNDICIFRLDDGKIKDSHIFQPIVHFEGEHLEDPRILHDGWNMWLTCCNFVWNQNNRSTYTHQVLFAIDSNFKCLDRLDIPYIGNGENLAMNTRNEKNWLWFIHEGKPHLIYACEPHLVAQFSNTFKHEFDYLEQPEMDWHFGEIRGGSPPARIGDEYWVFFHSSLPAPEHNSRRYHMGAYAFEAKPPFKPTRVTKEPLLTGSRHDRMKPKGPLVVFPCGSKLQDGTWTVSFGVNDLDCGLIEIPHNELLPLMKNL